jgi:hypothetical protein
MNNLFNQLFSNFNELPITELFNQSSNIFRNNAFSGSRASLFISSTEFLGSATGPYSSGLPGLGSGLPNTGFGLEIEFDTDTENEYKDNDTEMNYSETERLSSEENETIFTESLRFMTELTSIFSETNHLFSIQNSHNRQPLRFGLSRYLDNERLLNTKRYTPSDYETSEIIFYELREEWANINLTGSNIWDRNIDIKIKNILLDFYNGQEEERFPDLDELIEKLYIYKCDCMLDYNQTQIKKIIEHWCMTYGKYPRCNEIPYILEHYLLNKKIPSHEELEENIYRTIRFNLNPEEYHQNDKEFIPTVGIDKLPILKYSDYKNKEIDIPGVSNKSVCFQETCAICQEDFSDNQDVMVLIPCNHLFHSTNTECLENASIRNWLEKYNHCPLCKQKIKVN